MSSLLDGLNAEQKQAVTTQTGPLLILAGAGSGKTRVLTRRVAYLLENGVKPWNILCVTFTNKAAGEMKERVIHLVGDRGRDVWLGTFHSVCSRILRQDIEHLGFQRQFTIYDADDQARMMKELFKRLSIDPKQVNPTAMLSRIDRAKNQYLLPEHFGTPRTADEKRFFEIYKAWNEHLKAANALDFNDLLNHVITLWEQHPERLAYWQQRFQYVQVDEYQDTNGAQYRLLKLLMKDRAPRNLAVVGDDDQSIYSFRGADIRNILDFEQDFPEAVVIKLEQNYRSTATILAAAAAVVKHNRERKDKTLRTTAGAGEPLFKFETWDEKGEAEAVISEILKLKKSYRAADFAIIYRMNAQSLAFEQALTKFNLPYRVVGGQKFYNRKEVKDILAYLRLLLSPHDDVSVLRILNEPGRGLGDKAEETLRTESATRGIRYLQAARLLSGQGGRMGKALQGFVLLMDRLAGMLNLYAPHELVLKVAEETGYLQMLVDQDSEDARSRIENIRMLANAVQDTPGEDARERLQAFLDTSSLSAATDEIPDPEQGAVTLLTAHLAKGLEFPVVFVVGMAEGSFPHARAEEEGKIEEERRLAYVALTRAKERLYVSRPKNRRMPEGYFMESRASRFLQEIPPNLFFQSEAARIATRAAAAAPATSPLARAPASAPARPLLGRATAPNNALPRAGAGPSASTAPAPARASRNGLRTILPESLEDFVVGKAIFHPMLGAGVITVREGSPSNPRLTIHFDKHGPRTVYAVSANLELMLS